LGVEQFDRGDVLMGWGSRLAVIPLRRSAASTGQKICPRSKSRLEWAPA